VSISQIEPRVIPAEAKARLRIMFIAKHAKWAGGLHPDDGNHALYHVETREVLQSLGLNLTLEDDYEALFQRPDVDFLFPLLNRGGFLNSEMLAPLLLHGTVSPISAEARSFAAFRMTSILPRRSRGLMMYRRCVGNAFAAAESPLRRRSRSRGWWSSPMRPRPLGASRW